MANLIVNKQVLKHRAKIKRLTLKKFIAIIITDLKFIHLFSIISEINLLRSVTSSGPLINIVLTSILLLILTSTFESRMYISLTASGPRSRGLYSMR